MTSSAIAQSTINMLGDALRKAKIACISPITAAVVEKNGFTVDAVAEPYTMDGLVEARDLTPQKLERIEENQRRCGFSQIRTKAADATVPDPACVEQFDVVLVDAPCSGLGVLGRKPEIKYRVKPEDIEQLAVIQGQILTAAASYVKKGGRLVYSTCTLSDAENSGQIRQFVKTHPQYRISREELLLPQTGLPGNDGFYICVMNRAPAIESVRRKNKNRTASR